VTGGTTLYVEVGGAPTSDAGGFNGGGNGGGSHGGGGGGAPDIQLCPTAASGCTPTGTASDPRLIVAGGGGGSSFSQAGGDAG
jgi:hypothetical protein